MVIFLPSYSKVSDRPPCIVCQSGNIIKNGTTKNHKQQYYCKSCGKRFISDYTYKACHADTDQKIILLTREGLGIRSTARVLQISPTTLLKRILLIAAGISRPAIAKGKSYEVDEMRIFARRKSKPLWLVYALDRETKQVVSFYVGRRTNMTLNAVIKTLVLAKAKTIFTDGLRNYKYLIESEVHRVIRFSTSSIERKNLTLRTHIKRLNRKTICYTRNMAILVAILRIYFWA